MLAQVRSLIPAPIKRPVRRMLDAVDAAQRRRALARHTAELKRQARSGAVAPRLLDQICDAWGNKGFSADASFVAAVADRVMKGSGPFLDCGSGISTIVAGAIAQERGLRLISLEQDGDWHARLNEILKKLEITRIELWHTPLQRYGDFAWYALESRTLPASFTHVFCDGPAIFSAQWTEPYYSSWRVGLVPILQKHGVHLGEILLDDADDKRSTALRDRWSALGVATDVVPTPTGRYALGRSADESRGPRVGE